MLASLAQMTRHYLRQYYQKNVKTRQWPKNYWHQLRIYFLWNTATFWSIPPTGHWMKDPTHLPLIIIFTKRDGQDL